jgi:hypothetical protein
MGLLEQVRAAAAATSAGARLVRIQTDAIACYAASLPLEQARSAELDPATHYLGQGEGTLAYLLQLDAINFGSGYFPHLRKRPGMSGYFTVASSLKDEFDAHGPLSAQQLAALTAAECARIFGQAGDGAPRFVPAGGGRGARAETDVSGRVGAHADSESAVGGEAGVDRDAAAQSEAVVAELMGLFARALNDLGTLVSDRFGGSFQALVDAANGSAEQLVGILQQMPFYQDVGFYKRAQLTAADLALAGVAHFHDLDQLTIFADNLVPHVLRVDNILNYAPALLERIEREELIPSGSPEEHEIRACALHAVELIRRHTPNVTSMQLDYVLWNRGQAPAYKALPRHRTRTVFY